MKRTAIVLSLLLLAMSCKTFTKRGFPPFGGGSICTPGRGHMVCPQPAPRH